MKAAQMAGDLRGDEMLHRLERTLTADQLAAAREQAAKLQNADADLAAKNCAQ
jgi:hypothetical protein